MPVGYRRLSFTSGSADEAPISSRSTKGQRCSQHSTEDRALLRHTANRQETAWRVATATTRPTSSRWTQAQHAGPSVVRAVGGEQRASGAASLPSGERPPSHDAHYTLFHPFFLYAFLANGSLLSCLGSFTSSSEILTQQKDASRRSTPTNTNTP
jgi:hypothetical protein